MLGALQIQEILKIKHFNRQDLPKATAFIQRIIERSKDQQKIFGGNEVNFEGVFKTNFHHSSPKTNLVQDKQVDSEIKGKSVVGLARLLDSILQPFNHAGLQARTFCEIVQERIKSYLASNFHKLKDFKEAHQLTQELHKLNDDTEIYSLLNKLQKPGKKILIFDIDGTLRELEPGSEGHLVPNIDPKVAAALIKINKSQDCKVYFVTTRSPVEIKASNIPYKEIRTFCSNGEFLMFGNEIKEARHDVNPVLTQKTQEMEKAVKNYIAVNYPEMKVDFITNRGSVCFGIKGADYTNNIRSIVNDLDLISSGGDEWKVTSFGRFVSVTNKEFVADKYAPLIDIFLDPLRNGHPLTGSDIYIFGDSEAELQASTKLKEAGKEDAQVNLVMVRKNKNPSDKRVDFELTSPRTLNTLIKKLAS